MRLFRVAGFVSYFREVAWMDTSYGSRSPYPCACFVFGIIQRVWWNMVFVDEYHYLYFS